MGPPEVTQRDPSPSTSTTAAGVMARPDAPVAEGKSSEAEPHADPQQVDPRSAIERVTVYFAQLGVNGETALRFANTLGARLDPDETDPARRTTMMLEAFDRWSDELPSVLGMKAQADRVAFVAAMHLGRLLNQHPEALEQPEALADALRPLLDERPHGVLPNLPRQEMHRQPLGELPAVLQGEFWSGTYRWVVPVGASTKRMLRGHKKALLPGDEVAAAEGAASGVTSGGVSGGPPVAVEGSAAGE
ncbi:MAG: hypothetical protein AAF911_02645 [Planctomycetota bacterium]